MKLAIELLDRESVKTRRGTDDDRVIQMGVLLEQGVKLPPIKVTKGSYRVWAGHHRIAAHILVGLKEIEVELTPDKSLAELTVMGFKDNCGGSKPPETTDITFTIKRLLDMGMTRSEIASKLPMPKKVADNYVRYVHSSEHQQRLYRASADVRAGKITLEEAAKRHNVKTAELQALFSRKKATTLAEFKSSVTRRCRGAMAANGRAIKKMMEQVDASTFSISDGEAFLAHVDRCLNQMKKTNQDWIGRFKTSYKK